MQAILPVKADDDSNSIPQEVYEFARYIPDMAKDRIVWTDLLNDETLNDTLINVTNTCTTDEKSAFLCWKLKVYTQPHGRYPPKHLLECMHKEYVRTHIMDV